MGSIPQELSLDFKTKFIPQTITDFLKKLSTIYNVSERSSKLNDYINSLEDEMRKIDAFKRELPLCMLLLTDVIVFLKDESRMQYMTANAKPVLEEFIPLKKKDDDCNDEQEKDEDEDCRDKKNWMSSVQLWNSDDHSTINYNSKVEIKQVEEEVNRSANKDPFHSNKDKGEEEKTFIPFRGYPTFLSTVVARREDRKVLPVPGLSLTTPGINKNLKEESSSCHSKPSCSTKVASSPISKLQSSLRSGAQQPQHTSRKQRRCWSQELHRRFVNALQQLGGSQAATPKQIRELMQVDGLTNDEVKSHLQKYRLHGRRLPTGTPASSTTNQSVVVLGGLWTPQDQFSESSKQSNSQSGSPQGPLQLAANTGGTSITGDNSMDDDDEDEKSDSYSWRSHIHKPRRDDV